MDKESVLNVMKMVKEGTITSEEGVELINALSGSEKAEERRSKSSTRGKKLVIRVTPKNEKGEKANITIPLAFAGNFLKKIVNTKDMNVNMDDLMNGMNIQVDEEDEMVDIHIEE